MSHTPVFLAEAYEDLERACEWYESEGVGLGQRLARAVYAAIHAIAERPHQYQVLSGPFRRAVVRKFPYVTVFREDGDLVVVAAVWHSKRAPDDLLVRLQR